MFAKRLPKNKPKARKLPKETKSDPLFDRRIYVKNKAPLDLSEHLQPDKRTSSSDDGDNQSNTTRTSLAIPISIGLEPAPSSKKKCFLKIIFTLFVVIVFGLSIVVGFRCHNFFSLSNWDSESNALLNKIHDEINVTSIRNTIRKLALRSRPNDYLDERSLAELVAKEWKKQGLEEVKIVSFAVSVRHPTHPNSVKIVNHRGDVLFTATTMLLTNASIYAINSPNGTVIGDPVFANYGTEEDFDELRYSGVVVAGKICIIRMRMRQHIGNVIHNAENNGAVAVLLYLEPAFQDRVYPFPVPMDSVFIGFGDPAQQIMNTSATKSKEMRFIRLPSILCQPITFENASFILRNLRNSSRIPYSWQRSMGIKAIGPGLRIGKLHIQINNQPQPTYISNVCGVIKGFSKVDNMLLVGAELDNFGLGAFDSYSSLAQMLEITRILTKLNKQRTMLRNSMFCAFGGTRMGVLGIIEFLETHWADMKKVVAYVNIERAFHGKYFLSSTMPILFRLVNILCKRVGSPFNTSKSIAEEMIPTSNLSTWEGWGNQAPIFVLAGIPCTSFYFGNETVQPWLMNPPLNQSVPSLDEYYDPTMVFHKVQTELSAALTFVLANSYLLPFAPTELAQFLTVEIESVQELEFKNDPDSILYHLGKAIQNLSVGAAIFDINAKDNFQKPENFRMINERMLLSRRALVFYPRQSQFRTIFGTSFHNFRSIEPMVGLRELVHYIYRVRSNQYLYDLYTLITVMIETLISVASVLRYEFMWE